MRTPESPKTLYDKIFDEHVVRMEEDGTATLYIDRHLVHEVTSAQAFEGLRMNNRPLWRKSSIVATADHNTPTTGWEAGMEGITDPISKLQVTTLDENIRQNGCAAFFPFLSRGQGVIHVMGPEEGATLPGMTVVCGDSHTSTHGACAAIAFGIGTSEVEHVMATQTLLTKKMKNMRVHVEGKLQPGVFAKDLALYIIGKIGTAGGTGCAIEFDGPAIRALSMEGRMTLCNMAIEAGARCGLVACDDKTIEYMKGRPLAPEGELLDQAIEYWKTLKTDDDAVFDKEVTIKAEDLEPYVTWGTNPGQGIKISGVVPDPASFNDETERTAAERAIAYMGLTPGMRIKDIAVDTVFIGSCTNGRLEDLRVAASIMKGHHKAENIHRVLVVPASSRVRLQAEKEGLDKIFKDFGAEWRNAGCSMCLGMNPDKMVAHERSISTSNRNFEGRQGKGSRTHLASPAVAAATAIRGTISSPADL